MEIFAKILLYYGVGSLVAGSVMGIGFATNFARPINNSQVASLQRIGTGTYVPLTLEGIDGALFAASTEPRPTIIYIHGRNANRTELMPLAQEMLNAGYNAVLWDAKNRQISYGPQEIDQIRRIVASIRNDPHVVPDRIYLIGFSLGAAMAIGAAAADSEKHIAGIVADSAYANLEAVASRYITAFGIIPTPIAWPSTTVTFVTAKAIHGIEFKTRNPADWAERVVCPVLLIHGKSDKRIPPQNSEIIFDRLQSEKDLWLVDKAGHTQAFKTNPSEYTHRVLKFLNRD